MMLWRSSSMRGRIVNYWRQFSSQDVDGRSAGVQAHIDWQELKSRRSEMEENVARRRIEATLPFSNFDELFSLRERIVDMRRRFDAVQHERTTTANAIAATSDRAAKQALAQRGKQLKDEATELEKQRATLEATMHAWQAALPNWSDEAVRTLDEERVVDYVGGDQAWVKGLDPQRHSHLRIGKELGLFMWQEAAKSSGARFAVLRGGAALLELALVNWVMGRLCSVHGFTPLLPPDLVKPRYAASCGFQPRGPHSQTYHVAEHDLCLAATSEISVAALHEGRLFKAAELPQRFAAFSHCFRVEAGAGTEEGGLFRLHQFSKVEMFAVTDARSSHAVHADFVELQKSLVDELGLHARVVDMPPHELGASAARKFDIEAYFPSRSDYREVTSASNCTSYQARRLLIRYDDDQDVRHFAHTVNATALAIPRIIMCILETHLQPDGRVKIPQPLWPYMHGMTHIG